MRECVHLVPKNWDTDACNLRHRLVQFCFCTRTIRTPYPRFETYTNPRPCHIANPYSNIKLDKEAKWIWFSKRIYKKWTYWWNKMSVFIMKGKFVPTVYCAHNKWKLCYEEILKILRHEMEAIKLYFWSYISIGKSGFMIQITNLRLSTHDHK